MSNVCGHTRTGRAQQIRRLRSRVPKAAGVQASIARSDRAIVASAVTNPAPPPQPYLKLPLSYLVLADKHHAATSRVSLTRYCVDSRLPALPPPPTHPPRSIQAQTSIPAT
eukprot:364912-Chlamydomonas_euryale.AAC.13